MTSVHGDAAPMTRVLFLVAAAGASPEPWLEDVRREANGRLDLRIALNEDEADFSEVTTVIDVGGWASDRAIDRGAAAGVELWQVLGYGLDHINVAHVHQRGMILAHTPGPASAIALAEHAMCLMLAIEKHVFACRQNMADEVFGTPLLGELCEQELLIIGYGASGRALGARAAAFGMKISAADLEAPDDPLLERTGQGSGPVGASRTCRLRLAPPADLGANHPSRQRRVPRAYEGEPRC